MLKAGQIILASRFKLVGPKQAADFQMKQNVEVIGLVLGIAKNKHYPNYDQIVALLNNIGWVAMDQVEAFLGKEQADKLKGDIDGITSIEEQAVEGSVTKISDAKKQETKSQSKSEEGPQVS